MLGNFQVWSNHVIHKNAYYVSAIGGKGDVGTTLMYEIIKGQLYSEISQYINFAYRKLGLKQSIRHIQTYLHSSIM